MLKAYKNHQKIIVMLLLPDDLSDIFFITLTGAFWSVWVKMQSEQNWPEIVLVM